MPQYISLPDLPIQLNARGEWLHGGRPMHPRVATLFGRSLVPDPSGYQVVLGKARQRIEVEDTAYFVQSLHTFTEPEDPTRLQRVLLRLSDGAEEALLPQTLMQSAQRVLYCQVVRHGLRVPVRFAPQQYHALMLFADTLADAQAPDGVRARLHIGGIAYVVGDYSRTVAAADGGG